jgi:predicted DNA-binding transcriptional regulator AlpA
MKPAYLDRESIANYISVSVGTLQSMVQKGVFPKPRQISAKKEAWLTSEVESWCESRPNPAPRDYSGSSVFHLYRHFDAEGRLLYVGVSLSALNRLAAHKMHSKWYWKIARVEITNYGTRQASLNAEYEAIVNEKPMFNIVHNLRGEE